MAGLKIKLVADVTNPPDQFVVPDPETGGTRVLTLEEMVALVTQLVREGKVEIVP